MIDGAVVTLTEIATLHRQPHHGVDRTQGTADDPEVLADAMFALRGLWAQELVAARIVTGRDDQMFESVRVHFFVGADPSYNRAHRSSDDVGDARMGAQRELAIFDAPIQQSVELICEMSAEHRARQEGALVPPPRSQCSSPRAAPEAGGKPIRSMFRRRAAIRNWRYSTTSRFRCPAR